MRQDSKSRWENGWMFPRRWMLPALNSDFSNNTDIFKSKDSKSRWENGWMFPRRWMLPALNTDFPNNMDIFKSKDNEVIRVKEDDTKMGVSLDTSQYRPDE